MQYLKSLAGAVATIVCCILIGVAHGAECVSIAGTYNGVENGSITCTVGGDSETIPASGAGSVVFAQQGCSVSYQVPGTSFTRHGAINGNMITLTGVLAVFQPGVVATENIVTVTGTINNTSAFTLTGSGRAAGTVAGEDFLCTATSRATFTRSGPAVGQLQMPTNVNLGTITVGGTSAAMSVNIANVGAASVTVSSITTSNASEFPITSNGCTTIAAGSSCLIAIAFRPSALGTRSGTITVAGNATGSPQSFTVSGIGVSPTPPPALNYEGLWWKAPAGSESGWGINFAHQGDVIFATWFTYDLAGKGWWLVMTAPNTGGTTFAGTLYQTSGPAFDAIPFDPALVSATVVGMGTITFSDANNATFAYSVNGISQTKTITREVFGPLPTCTFGAQPNLSLATDYQDLWWNEPPGSESGWGINLTQQGDTIFATWFTYDHDHTPLWLVVTAPKTGQGVYSGTLYRTTGPAFNAVPFNPANVVGTAVGTATFTFSDGNKATFAYTVNGISQTKSITREVFRAPGTVCQ